jgi:hypothetical protein
VVPSSLVVFFLVMTIVLSLVLLRLLLMNVVVGKGALLLAC